MKTAKAQEEECENTNKLDDAPNRLDDEEISALHHVETI